MSQTMCDVKCSVAALSLMMTTLLCGCHLAHTVGVTKTGAPKYKTVDIVYSLKEATGALAANDFSPAEVITASAEEGASTIPPFENQNWSNALLHVQYPHPEGKTGYVRATLRLSQGEPFRATPKTSWQSKINNQFDKITKRFRYVDDTTIPLEKKQVADDEIWYYDFPKAQLDLMLTDLAGSGFFENQQRPTGSANLSIAMDYGKTAKNWTPEPRLDEVILLVYREGWLHGFAENKLQQADSEIVPVVSETE